MPMPCSNHAVLKATSQGQRTVRQERGVGDLPAFGYFRLPHGVSRRLSESQIEMQLASVKPSNVFYGRGEDNYFGAST